MNETFTLLSDWRLRDPYVAILKGRIMNAFPGAAIVDITHYADKFDILQTAFAMKCSYKSFPEGTVHLILTNTTFTSSFDPVLLQFDGHNFICDDNGVPFMMFCDSGALSGFKLNKSSGNSITDMLEIAEIIKDSSLGEKLHEYKDFKRMFVQKAEYSEENKTIEGQIVYIDAFNNAITNVLASKFKDMVKNRPFSAVIHSGGDWIIDRFSENYKPFDNEMFLTENELGYIEIASYQSDVSIIADLNPYDRIVITY